MNRNHGKALGTQFCSAASRRYMCLFAACFRVAHAGGILPMFQVSVAGGSQNKHHSICAVLFNRERTQETGCILSICSYPHALNSGWGRRLASRSCRLDLVSRNCASMYPSHRDFPCTVLGKFGFSQAMLAFYQYFDKPTSIGPSLPPNSPLMEHPFITPQWRPEAVPTGFAPSPGSYACSKRFAHRWQNGWRCMSYRMQRARHASMHRSTVYHSS